MDSCTEKVIKEIAETLTKRGETVSTAESCTGGRIAAMLTAISGASKYFIGGIVAYQNEVKVIELDVNPIDIGQYDVVSKEVVEQMVKGACEKFNTTYAIATSGYTDTGSDKVPAGTIWVGVGTKDKVRTECFEISPEIHDRDLMTHIAAEYAIDLFNLNLGNEKN